MNIDTSIVSALLNEYDKRPTGYKAGDIITYGALAPEFLYRRLNRPDANDSSKYPLGTSDSKYQDDMKKWTKTYGKDGSFAAASAAQMVMVRKAFDTWEEDQRGQRHLVP